MKKTVNFLFPEKKITRRYNFFCTRVYHKKNSQRFIRYDPPPPFAVVLFIAPHPSTSGRASLGRLFLSRTMFLPQTSAMSPVTSTGLGVLKKKSMEISATGSWA